MHTLLKTLFTCAQYLFALQVGNVPYQQQESKLLDVSMTPFNWQLSTTTAPQDWFDNIITSSSGQYSYAASEHGVFKSTDFAVTWSVLPSTANNLSSTIICSGDGSIIIVQIVDDLYISSNYGNAWSLLVAGDSQNVVTRSMAMSESGQYIYYFVNHYTSTPFHLLRSNNFGQSFTDQVVNIAGNVISCSGTGQYVFVSNAHAVGVSNDYGVSFTLSPTDNRNSGITTSIATTSGGQYVAIIIDRSSIYTSSDFGATWTESNFVPTVSPLSSSTASNDYQAILIDDSGQYLAIALSNNYIYQSSDGGSSWVVSSPFTAPWSALVGSRNMDRLVAVTPSSGNIFYLHSSHSGNVPTFSPTSTPEKAAWDYSRGAPYALYSSGSSSRNGRYILLSANGEKQESRNGNYGVYYSSDYGSSFSLSVLPSNSSSYKYNVVNTASGVFAVATQFSHSILLSQDFGASFDDVTPAGYEDYAWYNAAISNTLNYVFVLGRNAVDNKEYWFRSIDSMDTWTTVASSFVQSDIACSLSGQYVIIVSLANAQVAVSSNYGVSYTTPTISSSVYWVAVAISDSGQHMYLVGTNSLGGTAVSSNYGASFTTSNVNIVTFNTAVSCSANGQIVTTVTEKGDVYTSYDYGQHWSLQLQLPAVQFSTVSTNEIGSQVVAAGSAGFLYVFTNSTVTSVPPTVRPTQAPSRVPTVQPTAAPTITPSVRPSVSPSVTPSARPSAIPTVSPSSAPTATPSLSPTRPPTCKPSVMPSYSFSPSRFPTASPTFEITSAPSSAQPTAPTQEPSLQPTAPTESPSTEPTIVQTEQPSTVPTPLPTTVAVIVDEDSDEDDNFKIIAGTTIPLGIALFVLVLLLIYWYTRRHARISVSGNPPVVTYQRGDPQAPVQTSASFAPSRDDIEVAEAQPLAVILGTDADDLEEGGGGMVDIEEQDAETELITTAHWANSNSNNNNSNNSHSHRGAGRGASRSGPEDSSNHSALEISSQYVRVLGNDTSSNK